MTADVTKAFEYLLATGNLRSKTGESQGLKGFFHHTQYEKQYKTELLTESNLNAETIDCELMKTVLGKGIVGKKGGYVFKHRFLCMA